MHPPKIKQSSAVPLAFLVALTAGCAAQQPPVLGESDQLAAHYPDANKMAIETRALEPEVDSTQLNQPPTQAPHSVPESARVEVMRGGRYTLVAANATLQQRDLLEQSINISIPAAMNPTVEDGLRYVLQHTGYSLSTPQGNPEQSLYSRPLPAAHFRLGPMPLREALQVIAGDAYEVQVDPIMRTIHYQLHEQGSLGGRS